MGFVDSLFWLPSQIQSALVPPSGQHHHVQFFLLSNTIRIQTTLLLIFYSFIFVPHLLQSRNIHLSSSDGALPIIALSQSFAGDFRVNFSIFLFSQRDFPGDVISLAVFVSQVQLLSSSSICLEYPMCQQGGTLITLIHIFFRLHIYFGAVCLRAACPCWRQSQL